ncbi:hypothetical protein [Halobellus rubicundus]|uniref:Uncharacterized protein n=1 Tax=Halobellus rubicundus TaxID=2996466 RepID=A0ABD5MAW3_9EURY
MTTERHRRYANQWLQEALGIGVVLGIIAYGLITIGGTGAVMAVVVAQFLAVIALVYSLFGKVESMIYEIAGVDDALEPQDDTGDTKEWSHEVRSDGDDHKVVQVTDGVQTANFVLTDDDIRLKSRVNQWLISDDWTEEATQYLEAEFCGGGPNR